MNRVALIVLACLAPLLTKEAGAELRNPLAGPEPETASSGPQQHAGGAPVVARQYVGTWTGPVRWTTPPAKTNEGEYTVTVTDGCRSEATLRQGQKEWKTALLLDRVMDNDEELRFIALDWGPSYYVTRLSLKALPRGLALTGFSQHDYTSPKYETILHRSTDSIAPTSEKIPKEYIGRWVGVYDPNRDDPGVENKSIEIDIAERCDSSRLENPDFKYSARFVFIRSEPKTGALHFLWILDPEVKKRLRLPALQSPATVQLLPNGALHFSKTDATARPRTYTAVLRKVQP